MFGLVLWTFSIAATLAQTQPVQLPDELANLNAIAAQEEELLKAVREFDKQQGTKIDALGKEAEALKKEGKTDDVKAKMDEAVRLCGLVRQGYEFALERFPRNARLKTYYGELKYDRYGEFDDAVKQWEGAIIIDPRLSIPYNDLGIHHCHIGDYTKGLQYYDRALELDPENSDYLFNIVQTYLINYPDVQKVRKWKKAKVYKEAMKLSQKAAKLSPDDFSLAQDYALNFFTAENFDVKADWKEAAEAWREARKLARNDDERFNTWLNEARAAIQGGNNADAGASLEEALKIRPESKVAKNLREEIQASLASKRDKAPKSNIRQP